MSKRRRWSDRVFAALQPDYHDLMRRQYAADPARKTPKPELALSEDEAVKLARIEAAMMFLGRMGARTKYAEHV